MPSPVRHEMPTAYRKLVGPIIIRIGKPATNLEVLVEFVQDEAHTIHKTAHVRRLPFRISGPAVRGERHLKGFKVLHPLHSKVVWLDVCFIEDQDKGELGFVQYTRYD